MLTARYAHETEIFTDAVQPIDGTVLNRTLMSLSELLQEDILVSLRLRAVEINLMREIRSRGIGGGYEVILFGRLATTAMHDDAETLPAQIDVAFGPDGKIRRMTIAVVDPQALTSAIRNTTQEIGPASF
jgi:hypothetical protein